MKLWILMQKTDEIMWQIWRMGSKQHEKHKKNKRPTKQSFITSWYVQVHRLTSQSASRSIHSCLRWQQNCELPAAPCYDHLWTIDLKIQNHEKTNISSLEQSVTHTHTHTRKRSERIGCKIHRHCQDGAFAALLWAWSIWMTVAFQRAVQW